ncbi:Plasmodium exported protein (Pm-fam-a like), unknown function [Plasmodium malariae]|uniref:Fam-l protein n=1 Tax=Plasmodium malariae TaxID=5858 RepID=A0A1A8WUG4_PLAMA|nr:Plasmodium exported protein (Pm-fam-a like), unknown function [Plasmodium malariae]
MVFLCKNLDEKCKLLKKLNTKNYRLLEKYKQDKDLYIANIKEEMPHNEVKKKKGVSNSKKGKNGKHKPSCGSTLYIEEYQKNVEKNKSGIAKTKKHINFEKTLFKELDYIDYLKNIKAIDDKVYKNVARKKRRIRIILLLLFFLVLTIPILDLLLEKLVGGGLLGSLGLLYLTTDNGVQSVNGILSTLFMIDGWSNSKKILWIIYYYKKVIKYENMKFRKRINKK